MAVAEGEHVDSSLDGMVSCLLLAVCAYWSVGVGTSFDRTMLVVML